MISDNEIMINAIAVRIGDDVNLPLSELKDALKDETKNYSVKYMETTLPSTGDGAATKMLLQCFIKGKAAVGMKADVIEKYVKAALALCQYTNKELNMITKEDVEDYLNSCRRKGNTGITIKDKFRWLSSVYSYLYKNSKIATNPIALMDTPQATDQIPKPLTCGEVEKLKIACESLGTGEKNKRAVALLYFLLHTGVRAQELCNINIEDIDFINKKVVVLGKGDKEREVFFKDSTLIRLQMYLSSRDDIICKNGDYEYVEKTPLFTTLTKPRKRLSKPTLEREIKRIGIIGGVPRVHPHLLRDTYATNLFMQGADIALIAKLLGHANFNTLHKYILPSTEQLRAKATALGMM